MADIKQPIVGTYTKIMYGDMPTDGEPVGTEATTEITNINDIGTLADAANVVTYNEYGGGYVKKLKSIRDAGTLPLTLNYVPADTSHIALEAAYRAAGQDRKVFKITWVDGADNTSVWFVGLVSKFERSQPVDGVVTAAADIAIDGAIYPVTAA